jgi:uncharacterized protein
MIGFTPLASLIGGAMIGLSAALMLLLHGRIAGVSGIAARLLPPVRDGMGPSRLAFLAGLIVAPALHEFVTGGSSTLVIAASPLVVAMAGLLVGLGTVLGNGCTSGHGVCGLSRLSRRSFAATGVFMAAAMATVFIMRHGF